MRTVGEDNLAVLRKRSDTEHGYRKTLRLRMETFSLTQKWETQGQNFYHRKVVI